MRRRYGDEIVHLQYISICDWNSDLRGGVIMYPDMMAHVFIEIKLCPVIHNNYLETYPVIAVFAVFFGCSLLYNEKNTIYGQHILLSITVRINFYQSKEPATISWQSGTFGGT